MNAQCVTFPLFPLNHHWIFTLRRSPVSVSVTRVRSLLRSLASRAFDKIALPNMNGKLVCPMTASPKRGFPTRPTGQRESLPYPRLQSFLLPLYKLCKMWLSSSPSWFDSHVKIWWRWLLISLTLTILEYCVFVSLFFLFYIIRLLPVDFIELTVFQVQPNIEALSSSRVITWHWNIWICRRCVYFVSFSWRSRRHNLMRPSSMPCIRNPYTQRFKVLFIYLLSSGAVCNEMVRLSISINIIWQYLKRVSPNSVTKSSWGHYQASDCEDYQMA